MATDKQQPNASLDVAAILGLLDPTEREDLAEKLGLESLDEADPALTAGEALDHVVALRLPFIQMMNDISTLLGQLDAAVRGNIRFVVLPESGRSLAIDFGPQVRQAVATALNRRALQDHADELTTRLRLLDRDVMTLCDRARPMPVKRYTGLGRQLQSLGSQLPPGHPQRRQFEFISDAAFSRQGLEFHPQDHQALTGVQANLGRLRDLTQRLFSAVSDKNTLGDQPGDTVSYLSGHVLQKLRSGTVSQEYPHPRRCTDEGQVAVVSRRIKAVEEALLAAADYTDSLGEVFDFFNLEIWKQRWRVYELWVLARIVFILRDLGGTLEGTGRIVDGSWTLKFTKDSDPALALRFDDQWVDVYYQYYQSGDQGGDMPDIAVKLRDSRFLAVLDPKHGKSYSRSDLNGVCQRYARAFDPYLSCVVNYFDVRESEVLDGGRSRSLVIYGLMPGADASTLLVDELAGAASRAWEDHGLRLSPRSTLIVLFDGSPSTVSVRTALLARLNEILAAEPRAAHAESSAIVFGEQVLREGRLEELCNGQLIHGLDSSGTDLPSAVEEALTKLASKSPPRQLWIVSDGDTGQTSALESSLSKADAQVTVLEAARAGTQTELRSLAERLGARYLTL